MRISCMVGLFGGTAKHFPSDRRAKTLTRDTGKSLYFGRMLRRHVSAPFFPLVEGSTAYAKRTRQSSFRSVFLSRLFKRVPMQFCIHAYNLVFLYH